MMKTIHEHIAQLPPEKKAMLEKKLLQKVSFEIQEQKISQRKEFSPCPLSFAQQRLWLLDQFETGLPVYNVPLALSLKGKLDVTALEKSLHEIAQRHEALRTTFSEIQGQPIQVIASSSDITLQYIDLEHVAKSKNDPPLHERLTEEARRPFDLNQGPLFRASVFRVAPDHHVLLVVMHHIVTDGWSSSILFQELSVLYEAFTSGKPVLLPELPIQYADFAIWQRERLHGEELERHLSFWQAHLANVPAALEVPTDHPRPAIETFRGARQTLSISEELTRQLKTLSLQEGVTLFMTLLTAFTILLFRYTGQEDVVVGSPVANRAHPDLEDLIGFFVNTLVLRSDLSGNPSCHELMQRIRNVCLQAYAHQDLPFEKLVEELHPERDLTRHPLFQVMFAFQNTPRTLPRLSGLSLQQHDVSTATAKFDLTFSLRERGGGLHGILEYNSDLFECATVARMSSHYQNVLQEIVAHPTRHIVELPILTEEERHQILVEWNQTEREYPKDKCIHELFEEQVKQTPDSIAVVFPKPQASSFKPQASTQLTYRQLNQRANQLAHYLRKQGVGPEVLVGICVERSIDMVIGLLGILKAGGAYVPLDPEYPQERLVFMLKDTQAPFLVTQRRLQEILPQHDTNIIALEDAWEQFADESPENLTVTVTPSNLVYVLYTSGSTGQPKGVAIEHRSPVVLVQWALEKFTPEQLACVLASTSLCFDLFVFELFVPLSCGGKILLAQHASELPYLPAKEDVTLINTVPSAITELLKTNGIPDTVQVINLAGEPLHNHLVQQIYQQATHRKVFNLYGPSEDTTYSTYTLIKKNTTSSPSIGRPIANTQVYILDRHLQPVPIGVPGEIYLGGAGLARGYLHRPDFTKERFIPNPFCDEPETRLYKTGDRARYHPDGSIDFLGRYDHQVKLRGFRIELGEIEVVLHQHPSVGEAVVIVYEKSPDEKHLAAYVVKAHGKKPMIKGEKQEAGGGRQKREGSNDRRTNTKTMNAVGLREYLKRTLPEYMIPSIFVFLDALPLTPNGKVDRHALPAPDTARPTLDQTYTAPRDDLERQLATIWEQVMDVQPIGVQDNFFELGGHSLLAGKLLFHIEETLNIRLPMIRIFQSPTVAGLAEMIRHRQITTPCYSLVPIQPQGKLPPLFFIYPPGHRILGEHALHYSIQGTYLLSRHLGEQQPIYGLRYGLATVQCIEELPEPPRKIEVLAQHFIQEIQQIQPNGPYFLCGRSNGGHIAYEMAYQFDQQGQKTALLVLLDSMYPRWRNHHLLSLRERFAHAVRRYLTRQDTMPAIVQRVFSLYLMKNHTVLQACRHSFHDVFYLWHRKREMKRHPYIPPVYPGKLIVFESRGGILQAHRGWEHSVAGGVEVVTVSGRHDNMMEVEPYVSEVAEKLRRCLKHTQGSLKDGHVERGFSRQMVKKHHTIWGIGQTFGTGIVLYGLDMDGWMQREALLQLTASNGKRALVIDVESHAPEYLHPMTLTVENEAHETVHTHLVKQPGRSEMSVELPGFFQHAEEGRLKIFCDTTFIPQQITPESPDTRELGIRIMSLRYA